MGRPRRQILATARETETPPDELTPTQSLARVVKNAGHGLYVCTLPRSGSGDNNSVNSHGDAADATEPREVLVELDTKFRNTIWLIRSSYVLVDLAPDSRQGPGRKIDGDIVNIVRDDRAWRKMKYWPADFAKRRVEADDDDDESTVGKLPPSYSDEEDEEG